jgi:uncharacterized membrane protein
MRKRQKNWWKMNEAVLSLVRKLLKNANLNLINAKLYLPNTENSLRHLHTAIQKMKTAESIIAAMERKMREATLPPPSDDQRPSTSAKRIDNIIP